MCLRDKITLKSHDKFSGMSLFGIMKSSFSKHSVRLLLLYRSPSSSLSIFYNKLREMVEPNLHVDIILGYFTLDIFNNANNMLHDILSG